MLCLEKQNAFRLCFEKHKVLMLGFEKRNAFTCFVKGTGFVLHF